MNVDIQPGLGARIHSCTQMLYSLCHATITPSIIDYKVDRVTKGGRAELFCSLCLLPEVGRAHLKVAFHDIWVQARLLIHCSSIWGTIEFHQSAVFPMLNGKKKKKKAKRFHFEVICWHETLATARLLDNGAHAKSVSHHPVLGPFSKVHKEVLHECETRHSGRDGVRVSR